MAAESTDALHARPLLTDDQNRTGVEDSALCREERDAEAVVAGLRQVVSPGAVFMVSDAVTGRTPKAVRRPIVVISIPSLLGLATEVLYRRVGICECAVTGVGRS